MSIYQFDPNMLPRDLLAEIGLAISSASQTENIMGMAIAGCLGLDAEYGLALTTHMSVPLKLGILRSVAEIRIDDLDSLDELDVILDRVERAIAKRNSIAHDSWAQSSDQFYKIKESARTSLTAEIQTVTVDNVRSDALEIYEAGMLLMRFLAERSLLAPFPPTSRSRAHKSKAARKARREKLAKENPPAQP